MFKHSRAQEVLPRQPEGSRVRNPDVRVRLLWPVVAFRLVLVDRTREVKEGMRSWEGRSDRINVCKLDDSPLASNAGHGTTDVPAFPEKFGCLVRHRYGANSHPLALPI